MNRWVGVGLVGLISVTSLMADSGADALMNAVNPKGITESVGKGKELQAGGEFQLSDPFLVQLFSEWKVASNLSYDVNLWVTTVLKNDFEMAAHLWGSIAKQLSGPFEPTAKAAYLYSLWRLDLPRTFLTNWIAFTRRPDTKSHRSAFALEQTIETTFDHLLSENAIQLSPDEIKWIEGLSVAQGKIYQSLRAWISPRNPVRATAVIAQMSPEHPLKARLAKTIAYDYAKRGDLASSAKVLKEHLEPILSRSGTEAEELSQYHLEIARLLYQAGSLDGAEQFYLKIRRGAKSFLTAREELTWVWLRKGDLEKLRGEIASLQMEIYKDRFAPEIALVRAVSNLKMCYFAEVQNDINVFVEQNKVWAKRIEGALNASDPTQPDELDEYSKLAKLSVEKLEAEKQRVALLADKSASAVLPAVGPQQAWVDAGRQLSSAIEQASKFRAAEYRRQWKSLQSSLREAIHKMQFVKVEYMSQLQQFSKQSASAAPREASLKPSAEVNDAEMNFPFDGVVWVDELFKLRAAAEAQCLARIKG